MSEELDELKIFKKILIALLIASGVDAQTVSDMLGYRSASSITNEFPVSKLQRKR
jgi:hypothetical protein